MSGRLIITSKKGYCPWNAKNLARIERDEKEHREAQEREREKQANIASASRLAALKKAKDNSGSHQERFCLFDEIKEEKKNEVKNFVNNYGRFGGYHFANQDARSASYRNSRGSEGSCGEKNLKRKRELDPMAQFYEDPKAAQDTPDRNNFDDTISQRSADSSSINKKKRIEGGRSDVRSHRKRSKKEKRKRKKRRREKVDGQSNDYRKSSR